MAPIEQALVTIVLGYIRERNGFKLYLPNQQILGLNSQRFF